MGDRGSEYGAIQDSFRNIATMWSIILGIEVQPAQVAWMMAALKIARGYQKHDSRLDLANYAWIADMLLEEPDAVKAR